MTTKERYEAAVKARDHAIAAICLAIAILLTPLALAFSGCRTCEPAKIQGETMDYWRGVGDGSKLAYDAISPKEAKP